MNTRVKMVSGTANKGNILNAMTDMQYQKRSYETDLFVVCIAFHSAPHDKKINLNFDLYLCRRFPPCRLSIISPA